MISWVDRYAYVCRVYLSMIAMHVSLSRLEREMGMPRCEDQAEAQPLI